MHEDPTRLMGPEGHGPDGGQPRGNMRLLVAGLIAVIVGLIVAVVVIAGNDNGNVSTASTSESVSFGLLKTELEIILFGSRISTARISFVPLSAAFNPGR